MKIWYNDKNTSGVSNKNTKELFNKYQQLEKLNRVIVDEFIDKIYIGKINEETNTRDIEIKWNLESISK